MPKQSVCPLFISFLVHVSIVYFVPCPLFISFLQDKRKRLFIAVISGFVTVLFGCNNRPITYNLWADAIEDRSFTLDKSLNNSDVIDRLRRSGRIISETPENVLVRLETSDSLVRYSKAVAMTPITVTIDGALYLLAIGAFRQLQKFNCSARFRFLDFPGYFHAFSPLTSELITSHATRSCY